MKSREVQATNGETGEVHFVHKDAPSVRVRHYSIEDARGVRFAAELTVADGSIERAVIDATSHEELQVLLEIAARAFAHAVRLRTRAQRPIP